MKPAVTMGGKETAMGIIPEVTETRPKKSRSKIRITLVVTCLVLLSACALSLGLYFGLNNRDITVHNHVYFKENQGDIIPADVTVSQTEEVFSFKDSDVVYDFSTGLIVYKSKVPMDEINGCLVESFNMTETKKPSELKDIMKEDQIIGTTIPEEFRITNVWLNEEALGAKSQELCADEEIRFLEKVGSGEDTIGDEKEDKDDVLPDLGAVPRLVKRRVRRAWSISITITFKF